MLKLTDLHWRRCDSQPISIGMLNFSHDTENRILLFTASDVLTTDDLRRMKRLANRFEAESRQFRTILDFTDVRASAVPASYLTQCTRLPEQGLGERWIVIAPQADLQELIRQYTRDQRAIGGTPPDVVVSLESALEHLDIDTAHFEQLH